MYIDSHCHLDSFSNLEEIIKEAKEAKIDAIITCGYSKESSEKAVEISKAWEGYVFPIVGIGPQVAMKMPSRDWKMKIPDEAVAIGEIGIDYHWAKTNEEKELQKECFTHYLDLAAQVDLPVVIHARKAHEDIIKILEEKNSKKVVWHCFSGSFENAEWANKQAHIISFPPIPSRVRKDIARKMDAKFIIESDAPYIGKKPTDVIKAAEIIAKAKVKELEEIASETKEDTMKAFGLHL